DLVMAEIVKVNIDNINYTSETDVNNIEYANEAKDTSFITEVVNINHDELINKAEDTNLSIPSNEVAKFTEKIKLSDNSSEDSSEGLSEDSSKDEVDSDKENQVFILLNPKKRRGKGRPPGTKRLKSA
ncbi:26143_t:CDS:2, partial [Dentiscutata erythropus]